MNRDSESIPNNDTNRSPKSTKWLSRRRILIGGASVAGVAATVVARCAQTLSLLISSPFENYEES